jgi:hypothetical protein
VHLNLICAINYGKCGKGAAPAKCVDNGHLIMLVNEKVVEDILGHDLSFTEDLTPDDVRVAMCATVASQLGPKRVWPIAPIHNPQQGPNESAYLREGIRSVFFLRVHSVGVPEHEGSSLYKQIGKVG